jgi:hypothetical protein
MDEKPLEVSAETRDALFELQRYLSDAVPPLMVADSLEVLLRAPVQLTASQIHAWAGSQCRGRGSAVPISDYLFHALKKLHLVGEYELVSRENLGRFIKELARHVLAFCPHQDRDLLRTNIARLGEASTVLASAVEYLHRQIVAGDQPLASTSASAAAVPASSFSPGTLPVSAVLPVTPELARGLRGFALLIERMERSGRGRGGASDVEQDEREVFSELLTLAAVNSRTGSELEHHLGRVRAIGFQARPQNHFRDLSSSLPDWSLPAGHGMAAPLAPLEAMHKIITLAEDPNQGAQRFREMVEAAIEKFNEGSLGRAATMIDLAERIIVEKRVDFSVVESVRTKSFGTLAPEMLRRFSKGPEKHSLLRKVMNFFTPLTPYGLIQTVQTEERREKRRLALALLEAHGPDARALARERFLQLSEDSGGDPRRYFARNLLYLLRRIPAGMTDLSAEVEIAARTLRSDSPPYLLKEAVAYLAQAGHEGGERELVSFLGTLEQILIARHEDVDPEEIRQIIDRTTAALARMGTGSGARAVIHHALKRTPAFGDTMARLADLGSQDLSEDPEMVELLLRTLKGELPLRILGFVVQRTTESALHIINIIHALAGTPAPTVRSMLEDIARRYPREDFGLAAAKTIAGFGAQHLPVETEPAVALSGDLELFGLPNLLQTLAESKITGVLKFRDRDGESFGLIVFESGRILDGRAGKLRGAEAVYQLFERPSGGNFQLLTQPEGSLDRYSGGMPMEVVPTLFEAMRRYDEFRQARLIVPDHVTFQMTGIRPGSPPEERDSNLVRLVWNKLRTGASAIECESNVAADSYRIRRLLVHWVEQGALQQI